jgi:hypothetical protein
VSLDDPTIKQTTGLQRIYGTFFIHQFTDNWQTKELAACVHYEDLTQRPEKPKTGQYLYKVEQLNFTCCVKRCILMLLFHPNLHI